MVAPIVHTSMFLYHLSFILLGGGGGMRQRILGSHTPPCHRRMVITTQFNILLGGFENPAA